MMQMAKMVQDQTTKDFDYAQCERDMIQEEVEDVRKILK
jgi:hypothetical protein